MKKVFIRYANGKTIVRELMDDEYEVIRDCLVWGLTVSMTGSLFPDITPGCHPESRFRIIEIQLIKPKEVQFIERNGEFFLPEHLRAWTPSNTAYLRMTLKELGIKSSRVVKFPPTCFPTTLPQ